MEQLAQLMQTETGNMKSTLTTVLVLLLSTLGTASELPTCCNPVGCFCNQPPWRTPMRPVPVPNCQVLTTISSLLYSRKSVAPIKTTLDSTIDIHLPSYNNKISTYFIVADYVSNNINLFKLKDAIISRENAYVFIFTWGNPTDLSYLRAVSDSRVVGAQLARLVEFLNVAYSANPQDMECIGHGLGAHICGYAGKAITLGRITALDAAGPFFEAESSDVQLDLGDSRFLVAVHTDAKTLCRQTGLGMIEPIGNVDFYIDGGRDQPGCSEGPKRPIVKTVCELRDEKFKDVLDYTACPHNRALEVYTYAVKNESCRMWGHKLKVFGREITDTKQISPTPKFGKCNLKKCSPLGPDTDKFPGRKSFYLPTTATRPFCIPEPKNDKRMDTKLEKHGH